MIKATKTSTAEQSAIKILSNKKEIVSELTDEDFDKSK